MPKEEWGTKRLCPTTGKRFYDMNRSPIVSPYTGDVVELDSSKTRMIAADSADAATTKAKVATAAEGEDQVIDDEDDVEVELDDDLLDDDEEEDTVPLEELADVAAEDDES
ncbi:MAG: TIGR02300 family protein, partial [Pseudomonadota bacterium]